MTELKKELKVIEVPVKKWWQSKTSWVSLITALLSFYKPAWEWVEGNPDMFMKIMGALFLSLRFVTKGKVEIK